MNKISFKMFYKCYSNLIDTFKVLYEAQKAFNCMCSKGGNSQLPTRRLTASRTDKKLFNKIYE